MSELVLPQPSAFGPVRMLLRAEGLAGFLIMVLLYVWTGGPWWLFLVLFLVPDLAFFGYLAGPRVGSLVYNALHVTLAPAILGGIALVAGWPLGVSIALIWAAHIEFDRALGYGLKYATGFGDTHLSRFGKGR